MIACGRNTRTPSDALVGHWESVDGTAHYYFSRDAVTFYFVSDDRLQTAKYSVLTQQPTGRTIEFRVQIQGRDDFAEINDRKLVFTADYKFAEAYIRSDLSRLTGRLDPKRHDYMQDASWRYVDSKQTR
jgi:hypothetical protein